MRFLLTTAVLTLALSLGGAHAQLHCPSPPPTGTTYTDPSTDSLGLTGRTEIFDVAVQAALDQYIDPTFGGHDLKALAAATRPKALTTRTDADFYRAMRDLFTLPNGGLSFQSPEESRVSSAAASGAPVAFGGIGVSTDLTADNLLRVHEVYPGAPAATAGLQPGETITAVDGRCPLIEHIRGQVGSRVELTVRGRDDRIREVVLTRASVTPTALGGVSTRLPGDIGYLEVPGLGDQAFAQAYESRLQALLSPPLKGLILDLRGSFNDGGDGDVRLLSLFLPANLRVAETRDRQGQTSNTTVTTAPGVLPELQTLPLVVLMDQASSLVEVAAVLQQQGRAKVVGQLSGGTGEGVNVPLPHGAVLFVRTADVFLPDGQRVGDGVTPDVTIPDDQVVWQPAQDDPTVARAVQLLMTGK